ncbi:MAG: hypothetical protein JXB39_07265 [Deltaproteobacteria bacterium]|nr:hypothetical protein [Deltaproteobacteria bacterium]
MGKVAGGRDAPYYRTMARRASLIGLGIVLLAIGGAAAWGLLRPDPPPPEPPDAPQEEDTGLSRKAVEERMRAIGYVQ